MPVIIREFRPLVKNSLRGFATVELPIGLIIKDISIMNSNGRHWAGMPGKPQLNGTVAKQDGNGKIQYVSMLEWRSRDLSDGFSDAVIAAMRESHPAALE